MSAVRRTSARPKRFVDRTERSEKDDTHVCPSRKKRAGETSEQNETSSDEISSVFPHPNRTHSVTLSPVIENTNATVPIKIKKYRCWLSFLNEFRREWSTNKRFEKRFQPNSRIAVVSELIDLRLDMT